MNVNDFWLSYIHSPRNLKEYFTLLANFTFRTFIFNVLIIRPETKNLLLIHVIQTHTRINIYITTSLYSNISHHGPELVSLMAIYIIFLLSQNTPFHNATDPPHTYRHSVIQTLLPTVIRLHSLTIHAPLYGVTKPPPTFHRFSFGGRPSSPA